MSKAVSGEGDWEDVLHREVGQVNAEWSTDLETSEAISGYLDSRKADSKVLARACLWEC